MDEIINLIVQKTGIAPEHARTAVQLVLSQLKTRLPESMQGYVDSALSGGAAGGMPNIADAASGLGKLLG